MPHFNSWSWPEPFIGALDEALDAIQEMEDDTLWEDKIDKAVWRGTGQTNLLRATHDKPWADVDVLHWGLSSVAENGMRIEEFCKYKYIIYAEASMKRTFQAT